MTSNSPVQVHLPKNQFSVTVYGAIGTPLIGPVFLLGEVLSIP